MFGFRSSKCKTSCKLCVSRIKLNRNKREIQLTQQRRQIAEMLKQGKNEYAWIRVEGVIREKNLLAAYEILELYLELIAVRMELLDKSKSCPKDMVEAITTLMFATSRVADLPELTEVRRWLSIKFGNELGVEGGRNFDGAEPPQWQVNVRLRQYLGVETPEPEDKLSMLSSIAQEAEIEFDLESFASSVMVQLDPSVTGRQPAPPIPTLPQLSPNGNYPATNYGVAFPSAVTPSTPVTSEPNRDAPVRPPSRPSFRVPHQGPSQGPYTDAQNKIMGAALGRVPDSEEEEPPPVKQTSPPEEQDRDQYQRLQQQYDAVPGPPKKETPPKEENEEDEMEFPTAPSAPPSTEDGIDSDLSRRLADLRKR